MALDKQRSRIQNDSHFTVIDAEKVDVDLIHRSLEMNPNPVLALYNYFLEKGIIKTA